MIKTNLAVLMAERGLKIADVYEATGISKTTLMAISENNGKGIQYETMDKLCNYFGVTPSEFFSYSPYMFKFYEKSYANTLDDIYITVSHQNIMKTYGFSATVISPKGIDFPVTENDADFIVSYKFHLDIEKSDLTTSYDAKSEKLEKEFYNIYDSLPVTLKSDLNNHFYQIVISKLASLNGKTISTLDGKITFDESEELMHDIEIKTGQKVIIKLFNSRDSRLSKIPLFVVDKNNIGNRKTWINSETTVKTTKKKKS
ncbi:hypothetical protein CBG04_01045 [Limosilactobacillus reuteri]|uniref:helix-turn-helix domain-containing protein n=1 Tax=Limosilactobacillus reuteri TaxID=1598 RepID=UPI000B985751|nr:helix-turn-helix transcriptional regulator [Limosilactobacillus reuteri]OYS85904.1 hypothetical protein CBG14_01190 [Limosilactobacillus reuteri]OYS86304.1 hypothetical protein CBG04_01045 [Limosilactobacillus reuteri]